ncbi:MAG: Transcriptional activator [Stictis urceolatum]|nr:Transcriptional activator [Stictis urceolata]
MLRDSDISIAWPNGSPELDLTISALDYHSRLAYFIGRIGEQIYRKKTLTGKKLSAIVQAIFNELSSWLKNSPESVKALMFQYPAEDHFSRESTSLALQFQPCLIMTTRKLVYTFLQRELQASHAAGAWYDELNLSSSAKKIIMASLTAASCTALIMKQSLKYNLVANYDFLDSEHIFSASLLLVIASAAYPNTTNDPLRRDMVLSGMSEMADRGNELPKTRHDKLLELQQTLAVASRRTGPVPNYILAIEGLVPFDCEIDKDKGFSFELSGDPQFWEDAVRNMKN